MRLVMKCKDTTSNIRVDKVERVGDPIIAEYPKGDERRYDTDNPQIAIPIEIVT